MLESKKELNDRKIMTPLESITETRNKYVLSPGSSKALDQIHVSYISLQERSSGDTIRERETVDLSFSYPKGRTNRHFMFQVNDRDYSEVSTIYLNQKEIPKDILEVLADVLPLEIRRILPALPQK